MDLGIVFDCESKGFTGLLYTSYCFHESQSFLDMLPKITER